MDRLNSIRNFINREKIYIWLLVFILVVNVLLLTGRSETTLKELGVRKAKEKLLKEEYSLTPEKLNLLIKEKREVVIALNLFVLLIMALLVLGLILDFFLLFYRSKGPMWRITTKEAVKIDWGIWDVCKAVILFVFFGYILIIIESAFVNIFPLIKEKEHIRMMVNSSILDALIVIFILYTVLVEYKERLRTLGLSLTDFFKNVFMGIAGYIVALPVIIGMLALVIWIAKLLHYEPPLEPVLKLFLEEKNVLFLLYATVFVTIFGPIFEEIFFRGFMYVALKKRIGVVGGIITTSVFFSLLHTNVAGFLPIMALGVLLAYLYERTGSLIAPIIVHIIHNTGMMAFVFLIKELKI